MKYTPEEAAKLLADRPNQAHYIEWVIRQCVAGSAQGLRTFADSMLQVAFEGGCADGADIQKAAIKAGLLREVARTEPCGEYCSCNEIVDFPTTCYKKTYLGDV